MSVLRHFERWIKLVIEEKIDWHCRIIVVEICYSAIIFFCPRGRLAYTAPNSFALALPCWTPGHYFNHLRQIWRPSRSWYYLCHPANEYQNLILIYQAEGVWTLAGVSPPIGLAICPRASTSSFKNRQTPINIRRFTICILFTFDAFRCVFMINKHMNKHIVSGPQLRRLWRLSWSE